MKEAVSHLPADLGGARRQDRKSRFSEMVEQFASSSTGDRVEFASIIEFMGERSIAALLTVLALPMVLPIPAPGLSVLFGIPMMLVAAQLAFGARRVWLPDKMRRRSIERAALLAYMDKALPSLRRLERIVRPRLPWLAGDWMRLPVGAICLILALIITLPVPLGHMVPGAAICLLALGLMERDGLVVGLGLLVSALAFLVIAAAGGGVAHWLHRYLG